MVGWVRNVKGCEISTTQHCHVSLGEREQTGEGAKIGKGSCWRGKEKS